MWWYRYDKVPAFGRYNIGIDSSASSVSQVHRLLLQPWSCDQGFLLKIRRQRCLQVAQGVRLGSRPGYDWESHRFSSRGC